MSFSGLFNLNVYIYIEQNVREYLDEAYRGIANEQNYFRIHIKLGLATLRYTLAIFEMSFTVNFLLSSLV